MSIPLKVRGECHSSAGRGSALDHALLDWSGGGVGEQLPWQTGGIDWLANTRRKLPSSLGGCNCGHW